MKEESFGLNLKNLSLKNFATFDDQEIQFENNFNAIVGETGSGKSLILDALQLILGHRADKRLIRKDCDFSIIEATFKCRDSSIKDYFFELGFPFEDEEVLIKRVLYKTGKTKSFLNHQACSLTTLVDFSKKFIDLVGQFENQKLLSEIYQLQLLDHYANHSNLQRKYKSSFDELIQTINHLKEFKENFHEINQRLDYINYQIHELEKLSPSVERENELLKAKKSFQNLHENKAKMDKINFIFEGSDDQLGILTQFDLLQREVDLNLVDQKTLDQLINAKEILSEINYSINTLSFEEFSEQEINDVFEELDNYQVLKRKFNVDTQGLVDLVEKFKTERDELDNIDKSVSLYEERVEKLKREAYSIALDLHNSRLNAAKKLSTDLTNEIQNLRMTGATIDINLSENEDLSHTGITKIHLLAETNPGEGYYKVKDIASGGELSRILLAIRKVLSTKDSISIFLFDEIDTGIGGETALSIGEKLSQVSKSSQVIAITHLPQIANFSDKLIKVSKGTVKMSGSERTVSMVQELIGADLKEEVKSMTSLN